MTTLTVPEKLTAENLLELGFDEYSIVEVAANEIEFKSKTGFSVRGADFVITPEGLKALGNFVGISQQYLKKLPDDLFAYTMNYFYRRAEDTTIELVCENSDFGLSVVDVQLSGTLRLSLNEIINLVEEATERKDVLFTEFTRENGTYTLTILGDKIERSEDDFFFPAMTIKLNDRLLFDSSYSFAIYRWGPTIRFKEWLKTKPRKNALFSGMVEDMASDISQSFEALPHHVMHSVDNAENNLVGNPEKTIKKVLRERGFGNKADNIIGMTSIGENASNSYAIAKSLVELAFNDRLNKSQQKKIENISGYVLQDMPEHPRCNKCLSEIDVEVNVP